MNCLRLLLFFILLSSSVMAQNLSGVWEGASSMGSMRLVVVQQGDSCFGYVFEQSMGSCTAHFLGRYDSEKKELKGSSPSFIQKDFGHGLAVYNLVYDNTGNREKLVGKAKAKSAAARILSFGMTLRCTLYRTTTVPDTTDFMTVRLNRFLQAAPDTPTLVLSTSLPDTSHSNTQALANRPSEVLHNIVAGSGSIKCTLYDNGVYDHDTITVLHNSKIILNRVEVSTRPQRFEFYLSKEEPVHEIIFYANNLGDLPPNTGILLIEAGEKRYSLSFKADLATNGKVVVRLNE